MVAQDLRRHLREAAVWYGGLILLGHQLGENWEDIVGVLGKLNKGLWVVALSVLAAFAVVIVRRRRSSRSRVAGLTPFDPRFPDRPAELEEGLPRISADALDEARRARRDNPAE